MILTLLAIKVWCPEAIHFTRSNNESQNMNKLYGYEGEMRYKYTEIVFSLFTEIFQSFPLAFSLEGSSESDGKKAFIVHGGLCSRDGLTNAEINSINRHCEPESRIMVEMLWSVLKRGKGVAFGPDITNRFLDSNGFDIIIRSHEMKGEDFEVGADGRLITIVSTPNY